jgi:hypothetical protein
MRLHVTGLQTRRVNADARNLLLRRKLRNPGIA